MKIGANLSNGIYIYFSNVHDSNLSFLKQSQSCSNQVISSFIIHAADVGF